MKMKSVLSIVAALALPGILVVAGCSKSKEGGGSAAAAIGGSCHNGEKGLCFQYPKAELKNEAQEADICDNDPGAKWMSGQACPKENVAQECQYKMGPFLKQERLFLYKNHARAADALAFCGELGYVDPAKAE